MARTERFEMRLTAPDRADMEAMRGKQSASSWLVGLIRAEKARIAASKVDRPDIPSSRAPE